MGLDHERFGNGRPLVLIHGLGGYSGLWRPVAQVLEAERDVVVPDLSGFGASPELPAGTPATAANLAEPVAALCEELGIERPDVAGNSLGAWVGLEMAKRGQVRSVTGISPAGLWREPLGPRRRDTQAIGRRVRPLVGPLSRSERGRALLLRTTVARPDLLSPAEAREVALNYIDAPGYASANAEMRAAPFEHEGLIDVPVTLAWGEEDRLVGRPSRTRMPPGSRFVSIPGWGHTPTWDDPEGVARLILDTSERAASE